MVATGVIEIFRIAKGERIVVIVVANDGLEKEGIDIIPRPEGREIGNPRPIVVVVGGQNVIADVEIVVHNKSVGLDERTAIVLGKNAIKGRNAEEEKLGSRIVRVTIAVVRKGLRSGPVTIVIFATRTGV